jgi:hypothetical protein
MCNHGHSQAVLLNVLGIRVVHQPPAPNEFHSGKVRKEVTHHVLRVSPRLSITASNSAVERLVLSRREIPSPLSNSMLGESKVNLLVFQ